MTTNQIAIINHADSVVFFAVGDIDGDTDGDEDGCDIVGDLVGSIVGVSDGEEDGVRDCPQWPIIVCSTSSSKALLNVSLKNEQVLVSAANSNAIQWKSLIHPDSHSGKVASMTEKGVSVKTRLCSLVQASKQ